jgi:putative ABC transport system permease protein
MKMILKYLFRNIGEKKIRSLIIVFAVLLTTLLLLLNLEIRNYFEQSYADYMRSSVGAADVVVTRDSGENSSPLFEAKEMDTAGVNPVHTMEVLAGTGKLRDAQDDLVKVRALGIKEQQAADMNTLFLSEKDSSSTDFAGDRVIISRSTAAQWGVGIGDPLTFTIQEQERTVTIYGIAENIGIFFQDNEDTVSFALPLESVNSYYGLSGKLNTVYLDTAEGADITGIVNKLQASKPGVSAAAAIDQSAMETQMNAVFMALMFVMLVILLISFYIISSLFQVIISERMPVIGTFQSIGATKRQMNGLLLLESMLYGGIGGLIGIGLSVPAVPYIFGILNQYEGSGVQSAVNYNPANFLFAFLFAVLVSVISSLFHILRTNRYPTKDIILNTVQQPVKLGVASLIAGVIAIAGAAVLGLTNTRYNTLTGLLAIVLLLTGGILLSRYAAVGFSVLIGRMSGRLVPGAAAGLGIKNTRSNRFLHSNITLTTVVLTLMITIYTVVLGVQTYMTDISASNDFDISITQLDSDMGRYEKLDSTQGVQEMYKDYLVFGSMQQEGQEIDGVAIIGMDEKFGFQQFHQDGVVFNPQEAEKLNDGKNIMIDKFIASKYNLKPGDTVTLNVEDSITAKPVYTVIRLMDSSNFVTTRKGAIISLDNLNQDFTSRPFQILFKTSGNREMVKDSLVQQLADTPSEVRTLDQIIDASTQGVDGLFMALNLFIALAMVLAGFGIMNNLIVSFLQRRRELAVLYSVCMSRNQLRIMFLVETGCVYAVSCLLAGLLSYFISLLLPGFLWGAGIAFRFSYPYAFVLILAAVLLVVFAVITLVPMIKFSRLRIVDQLKYD